MFEYWVDVWGHMCASFLELPLSGFIFLLFYFPQLSYSIHIGCACLHDQVSMCISDSLPVRTSLPMYFRCLNPYITLFFQINSEFRLQWAFFCLLLFGVYLCLPNLRHIQLNRSLVHSAFSQVSFCVLYFQYILIFRFLHRMFKYTYMLWFLAYLRMLLAILPCIFHIPFLASKGNETFVLSKTDFAAGCTISWMGRASNSKLQWTNYFCGSQTPNSA